MATKTVEETLGSEESVVADQLLDSKDDWNAREIGALWVRESKSGGQKFMTGKVSVGGKEVDIVVYKNKFKKATDNTPEFRIYVSKGKES